MKKKPPRRSSSRSRTPQPKSLVRSGPSESAAAIKLSVTTLPPPPTFSPQEEIRKLIDDLNRRIPPGAPVAGPILDPGIRQPWMDSTPQKRCRACREFRDYILFPRSPGSVDGYSMVCETCISRGESSITDAEIIQSGKGGRPRLSLIQFKVRRLLMAASSKAVRQGLPIDLHEHVQEIEDRVRKGRCEMTGRPFDLKKPLTAGAPSIYLKDPSVGLVYSNIQIVCWLMTCALGTWGEKELRETLQGWMAQS